MDLLRAGEQQEDGMMQLPAVRGGSLSARKLDGALL